MPTILEASEVKIPEALDGRSLMGLIKGDDKNWREYIHGEHCTCYSTEQEMQLATDGSFKYVWLPRIGIEQLFDLKNDPGELKDLSMEREYEQELKNGAKG